MEFYKSAETSKRCSVYPNFCSPKVHADIKFFISHQLLVAGLEWTGLEAATGDVLSKRLFLKISQYSQENTCVLEFLFNIVAGLKACNFVKKRPQHRFFPVNIAKFLRTAILKNIWERLSLRAEGMTLLQALDIGAT